MLTSDLGYLLNLLMPFHISHAHLGSVIFIKSVNDVSYFTCLPRIGEASVQVACVQVASVQVASIVVGCLYSSRMLV